MDSSVSLEADAGSSAQPKDISYPYFRVSPRKDRSHHRNSQCSKVLTFYQKNPLSTHKPPCLNLYFKMKIKSKAFVLNAQIPLPFLNPLFWKTPLNFLIKPSIVIYRQFPSAQTGFFGSFLHCRDAWERVFSRVGEGKWRITVISEKENTLLYLQLLYETICTFTNCFLTLIL